jgi:hypothetical protein
MPLLYATRADEYILAPIFKLHVGSLDIWILVFTVFSQNNVYQCSEVGSRVFFVSWKWNHFTVFQHRTPSYCSVGGGVPQVLARFHKVLAKWRPAT